MEKYTMLDMRFSQRLLWRVSTSGMQRSIIRYKSANISKEHIVSIFRVEEWAKKASWVVVVVERAMLQNEASNNNTNIH
jgi:hypothetical protein